MSETAAKVGVIPAPPSQEGADKSPNSSYYRIVNGVSERVTIVKSSWGALPIGSLLYNYSRMKKDILDGATGLGEAFRELEDELVDKRGAFLTPNPRSLLVGTQWTLGMEDEQPRGAYRLRSIPGSELPPIGNGIKKGEREISEGVQYSLGLDFNDINSTNGAHVNGTSPQTTNFQQALTLE